MDRPAIADYPAGARLPWRVIEDFELVWMLRGRAHLVLEDKRVTIGPSQLLLLPPRVPHTLDWDAHRPSRHGYVHFGSDHFGGEAPRRPHVRAMTADDPLEGLCAYLLWLGRRDDWEQPAAVTLAGLVRVFCDGPLPEGDAGESLPPSLAAAVDHLRQAWADPPLRRVGVAELAAASFVSRGYLSGLFCRTFGLSAAPALERLRCARAETLLRRTDLTVEAIARQCGFADLSHFSHRFTAIQGVSPSRYRQAPGGGPSVLDHLGVRRLAHLVLA